MSIKTVLTLAFPLLTCTFSIPATSFAQSTPNPLTTPSASLTDTQKAVVIAQLQQLLLHLTQQLQAIIAARAGQASGSTGGAAACDITRTLSLGMRDNDVSCLQRFLIQQHLLAPENATGYFGRLTAAAVKQFQSAHGLEPVGFVGPKTRGLINAAPPVTLPPDTGTPPPAGGGSTPPPPPVGGGGGGGGGGGTPPPPPITHASCTQDGITLAHGESRLFYSATAVASPATCTSISQSRTCTDGTLSGLSSYSHASCIVTGSTDTIPPSVPSGLTATVISSSRINLSWSASTDTGGSGLAGYKVYRNGIQVATTTAASHAATGLTASTTYSFSIAAFDAAGNVSARGTAVSRTTLPVITTPPPDTTAPTISLTAPANGATVSGSINITATASDNVGIAGVQFKIDGTNLGAEDTTIPYTTSWDTTTATNGAHTIQAVARDAAGNRATSTVGVVVNNIVTAPPTVLVKDILVYQLGGWSGVFANQKTWDLEWPLYGGKSAYLSRSPDILAHQMSLISGLGSGVAIAVLLMTDTDSSLSGYGTCWNGTWSGVPNRCDTGTFTLPFEMYDNVRTAARIAGVRYLPDFSLMNYDGVRGNAVLPKLQQAIAWWRTKLPDPYAAKSPDGKYYVLIDSLPPQTQLTAADKAALIAYMKSQTDIEWIDVLVLASTPPTNTYYHDNVYHLAWGNEVTQDWYNSFEQDHMLWTFQTNQNTHTYASSTDPQVQYPLSAQRKWMNVVPYTPSKYPVLIYQWNEYTAYEFFEPSPRFGTTKYEYLKSLIAQQRNPLPPDTTPPTVSITAPIAGTTVSGAITVTATASDNVGIAGIQFKLDNQNLGAEDTAAPYTVTWDTTTAANGTHTIQAVARDAAGNLATSTVGVTVANVVAVAPTISGVYPSVVVPGTPISIGGTGFSLGPNVIHFAGPSDRTIGSRGIAGGKLLQSSVPSSMPVGTYAVTVTNGALTSAPATLIVRDSFARPATPSASSAQTTIFATLNPCVATSTYSCATEIHWDAPSSVPWVALWVRKDGAAPAYIACFGRKATSTPPWITEGHTYEFSAYAAPSCASVSRTSPAGLEWLASVTVTAVHSGRLGFAPSNIGAVYYSLFQDYQGRGRGQVGDPAGITINTMMARKAMDDAKMLMGANYVRVVVTGWSPQDMAWWLADPTAYWARMDTMMHDAHIRGLGIIVDFMAPPNVFPALTGETVGDLIGNPDSASYRLYTRYIAEFVNRYKNDPQASIYAYAPVGEENGAVDINPIPANCSTPGWMCATTAMYSTNQFIAFQTRLASYIRTLDQRHPIVSESSPPRVYAYHMQRYPVWRDGKGDATLDSKEQLVAVLTQLQQGLDLFGVHFYNYPAPAPTPRGFRNNERFCPGPDCMSGANNAELLDLYNAVARAQGKRIYVGEYGDYDPYLASFLPGFGPFARTVLDKTASLVIPYSAMWVFEVYGSLVDPAEDGVRRFNIEPGYTDQLLQAIRAKNAAIGSTVVPPSIAIPPVEIILTNPLDGATLTGARTILYAVASAPRVGATISSVQFTVDSVPVSTVTAPPYRFVLEHSTLRAGTHLIRAVATDSVGGSAGYGVTVTCAENVCTAR